MGAHRTLPYPSVRFLVHTRLEVLPRLSAPVATTGHLIALKTLAGRNQDLTDLGSLIPAASTQDLKAAREAVRLIHARGFNREQDVATDLDKLMSELKNFDRGCYGRTGVAPPGAVGQSIM
jgi:hypothetical protein